MNYHDYVKVKPNKPGDLPEVIFRGQTMVEGWPEKLEEAQSFPDCEIRGKRYPRVRYGEEQEDWGAEEGPCHDCSAIRGEFHVEGCDVERCVRCGGQRFNCDCELDEEEL